ncbi:sugar phosphate isomerase/epimerase family protein [Saccharothrix longispora]|uniref:sugar phosphate isomerase/epimerase family protein n=1 Tax=Saccharothrix longispora TaxID=33920 RepID=UPI0028FD5660|nr:sugar phosphate isomerase/epimerase family protein [Saccharothrix longispora]MDU0288302.1 sugar phosphate isomerase/epimerase family protein [Saccharothrix longispora]
MAKYRATLNMEYIKDAAKGFQWGVEKAAELGYRYVEPMVHTGWDLLSEVDFFHSFSMEEDPLLMKEICDRAGVRVSGISGHSPLMKPEAAVPRLTRAIVFADACGAKFVNTDDMIKPDWMDDAFAHEMMRYTLTKAGFVAERHGVNVCIEPHGTFSCTSAGLLAIADLAPSPWINVNFDTGNFYLAALEDLYEGLDRVKDRVIHMHAKDISEQHSADERGLVTGTPVGCALGEGMVDWERVFEVLEPLDREIFLSVECGRVDEAERSLQFLRKTLGDKLIE